jgi:hypothetical protein
MVKKIGQVYDIVKDEFSKSEDLPKDGLRITKSVNCAAVEINYVDTWKDGEMGIPIFSIEDMYAGSNLIQVGMGQMGIRPPLSYDGNLMVVLGQGNLDEEGELIPDNMRLAVKGLVKTLEIIIKWSKKE